MPILYNINEEVYWEKKIKHTKMNVLKLLLTAAMRQKKETLHW